MVNKKEKEQVSKFIQVSGLLGDQYPDLEVCSNSGTVRVFQWQSEGSLTLDHNRGVKCEDTLFIEKARNFLGVAKEEHASLVLTPEYSFPYEVLNELIDDKVKWPEQGKLWCLGTQGESRDNFNNILKRWENKADVEVVDYASTRLHAKSFVCPLIYLFLNQAGKLVIIPQFKTESMADPRLSFEGSELCEGQTIFVFESVLNECENVFLSLICADAIGVNSEEIFQAISKKSILLFNPQLNQNPRHERMLRLRDELINNNKLYVVRILTLTWSEKTQVMTPLLKFRSPWSAFFKRESGNLEDVKIRVNKENNHKNGTGYVLNNHVEIWFSPRYEHCKSFIIRKSYYGLKPKVLTAGDEPKTEKIFLFDRISGWVSHEDCCMSDIYQLYNSYHFNPKFPYPNPMCGHNTKNPNCDGCRRCDWFFGSLLGKFEDGELNSNFESVERLLVGSDDESDRMRVEKLSLLNDLKRNLDKGNISVTLGYFISNYELFVHDDFPDLGKKVINLRPLQGPEHNKFPEALVVITKEKREEDVLVLLSKLEQKLSHDYRNQILIYYKPLYCDEYIYYDKHLTGTSIGQPSFSGKIASIMKP